MKIATSAFVMLMMIAGSAQAFTGAASDKELDGYRGGFITADGFTIGFGAVLKTYIDDQIAAETRLSWDASGVHIATNSNGIAVDPAVARAAMTDALSQAGVTNSSDWTAGQVVHAGQATLIQSVGNNQIANILLNSGDGKNIHQDLEITLSLPGFPALQTQMQSQLDMLHLQQSATAAALGALGH